MSDIDELRTASASGNLTTVGDIFARWFSRPASEKREISCFRGALYDAIKNQHDEVASYLLSIGVPLNMDIVVLATQSKSYSTLQLLLDHGWDINEPVLKMNLPPLLMYAIDDKDLTWWFLSHGARPDADCGLDIIPLSIAVVRASFDTIKLLFDHGGTIEHGQLLHSATRRPASDRRDVITFLLENGQLLHSATRRPASDCRDVIAFLLENGADVNHIMYQDHQTSYLYCQTFGLGTPLYEAAQAGAFDVVQILLERGADP